MVTTPRQLNMDHLKFHKIQKLSNKMGWNGKNKTDGAKRK
jgi:hypothetical protein